VHTIDDMAKAKTSTFTITEEIALPTSAVMVPATIPIGSLIDVGDAQALEIEMVDYVFQLYDSSTGLYEPWYDVFTTGGAVGVQLMDKNESAFISASDNNLISSATLSEDAGNMTSAHADMYPDDFKQTAGRFVVNDELYVLARASGTYSGNHTCRVSLRIRAKIVKLSTRDWMAISLETVQNE
jgi:hypothetical protein